MKVMKFIRTTLSANLMLIAVFAMLPILALKPDVELMQAMLEYINKD